MSKGRMAKGLGLVVLAVPVLALGVLVAGIAWAGGPGGPKGPGCKMMEKHRAMLIEDLELTEEQQAQLDGIHELIRDKHEAHKDDHDEHLETVLAAVETGEIDDEAVHDHIDAKADEMRESMHEIADEVIAFVRGLDEEQRATLADKLVELRDRMERFRNGDGPGHGPFGRGD